MWRILCGACLFWLLWGGPAASAASTSSPATPSVDQLAQKQLEHLDLGSFGQMLQRVNQQSAGVVPTISVASVLTGLMRGQGLPVALMVRGFLGYFMREVWHNLALLGKLLILAAACAVLEHLAEAFGGQEVSKIAYAVAYLALLGLALESFGVAIGLAHNTVGQLVAFQEALLPMLTGLLAGVGALTTAALFHPIMLLSVDLVSLLVQNFVLPLLFFAVVLEIVGQLTRYRLQNLASLLRQVALWALGLFLTLFVGVVALYGAAGPIADSLTLRTGKFVANAFVPVVGKLLGDATDIVMGSSLILKNVVGVTGVLGILVLVLMPVLKLLAMVLVFRVAAALMAPVGAGPLVDSLTSMASGLTFITIAVAVVGMLFFISLTVVIGAGNPGLLP